MHSFLEDLYLIYQMQLTGSISRNNYITNIIIQSFLYTILCWDVFLFKQLTTVIQNFNLHSLLGNSNVQLITITELIDIVDKNTQIFHYLYWKILIESRPFYALKWLNFASKRRYLNSWLNSNLLSTTNCQNRTIFDRFRNFDLFSTSLQHFFWIPLKILFFI